MRRTEPVDSTPQARRAGVLTRSDATRLAIAHFLVNPIAPAGSASG